MGFSTSCSSFKSAVACKGPAGEEEEEAEDDEEEDEEWIEGRTGEREGECEEEVSLSEELSTEKGGLERISERTERREQTLCSMRS